MSLVVVICVTGLAIISNLGLVMLLLHHLGRFEAERLRWDRERGLLLNRIKPETAQDPTLPDDGPGPQPAAWDASEEWWAEDEVT